MIGTNITIAVKAETESFVNRAERLAVGLAV
jgi:hypothetical protein